MGFLGVAPTTGDLAMEAPTGVMLDGIGATDAEANRAKVSVGPACGDPHITSLPPKGIKVTLSVDWKRPE